jgi:hypothetical protein
VENIITKVASGHHVASTLETAKDMVRDKLCQDKHIKQLARIASSRNAERDFHLWLVNSFGLEHWEPYELSITLLSRDEGTPRQHKLSCLPPHELFALLWSRGQQTRQQCLLGAPGALKAFWDEALQSPAYCDIPCVEHAYSMVPLLVHYDGCEIFNLTEYACWQTGCILAEGSDVLDQNYLNVIVENELINAGEFGEDAHAQIAEFFAWSFRALLAGTWPEKGVHGEALAGDMRTRLAGTLLAGGLRGFCIGFQCDMKARREAHRHDRWFRTTNPCQKCLCSQPRFKAAVPEHSFANFGEHAPWTRTSLTDAEYMRTATSPTPWAALPGFKPLTYSIEDWMHNFSLGVGREVVANAIVVWLENGTLRKLADDRGWEFCDTTTLLRALHLEFRAYLRQGGWGVKQSENLFTHRRLHRTSLRQFPTLTTKAKAVVVDLVVRFLSDLAPAMMVYSECKYHLAVCVILQRARSMQDVMLRGGIWLELAEASVLQVSGRSFLKIYGWLSREAVLRKLRQWRLKPKLHDIDEMLRKLSTCKLNPRRLSCARPEPFLGKVKKIAKATHRGQVAKRTTQRYLTLLQVRALQRERLQKGCSTAHAQAV